MKNVSLFLIIALALGIFFNGCKKPDETPENQMIYNEIEYDLSQGVLENYGKWNDSEGYNLDLVLLSSGFTIHEVGGEIDSLSGTGHGIVFELYSNSSDKLDVGDYTYDDSSNGLAGTFNYADAVFDWNSQTEEGVETEAIAGSLSVIKSGDEYEISMDLTMEGEKTLTGFYKGNIKYYDLDERSVKKGNSWFN